MLRVPVQTSDVPKPEVEKPALHAQVAEPPLLVLEDGQVWQMLALAAL